MKNNNGISMFTLIGCCIAASWSWQTNHDIAWAILHTFFGWFYVIYRCLGYGG